MAKVIRDIIKSTLPPTNHNVLWLDTSGDSAVLKTYDGGKWKEVTCDSSYMMKIAYEALVKLRDNSQLTPGMQYRIIDYMTTTAEDSTKSAGNPFDIIVTAISENCLSEEAKATHSERDKTGYFSKSNLNAWKIRYCLDNDTTRFAWACPSRGMYLSNLSMNVEYYGEKEIDGKMFSLWYNPDLEGYLAIINTDSIFNHFPSVRYVWLVSYDSFDLVRDEYEINVTNYHDKGTGVIYEMIDEFGNECPYDFKNIQYYKAVTMGNDAPQFGGNIFSWVYTFCGREYHIDDDEWHDVLVDGSLESPVGHQNDEGYHTTFQHNVVKPYFVNIDWVDEDPSKACRIYLNRNIFLGFWYKVGSGSSQEVEPMYSAYCCSYITCDYNCYDNAFSHRCYNCSLGPHCYHNMIWDVSINIKLSGNNANLTIVQGSSNICVGPYIYSRDIEADGGDSLILFWRNSQGKVKQFNPADLVSS